jgi:microcystin-dependent protein
MSDPFIAEIRIFAGNFAPRSWAFCDGQLLPISQNTALFSLIGTTYGGDGRTTTALPNLQDRIPLHAGRGPGLTDRRLGQLGGAATHTLTPSELPSHSHQLFGSGDATDEEGENSVQGNLTGETDASTKLYRDTGTSVDMATEAITAQGGNGAHTNEQPHLTLNYIIALEGQYPSR